jgi:hypothetical protein
MRFWRQWLAVGGICAAAFFSPIRFETDALFYIHLMDAAHLPAFFFLTLFAYAFWPVQVGACRRRLYAAGAIAGVSLMIEVAQPFFGRSESVTDFVNGIAGVFLALILLGLRDSRRRPIYAVLFALALIAASAMAFSPAWRESAGMRWRARAFPLLASFEDDAELRIWIGSGLGNVRGDATVAERVREHSTHGEWALKVVINPAEKWPGVRLLNGKQDWRGKTTLAFDIWNDGPAFTLAMRVDDDFPHKLREDRFNAEFVLQPGANKIAIPVEEIERRPANRRLNLQSIQRTIFYVNEPKEAHIFFIDHVRLE